MLRFILTSWWFYVPIIAVLFYLTRRNNKKIEEIKAKRTQENIHDSTISKQSSPKPKHVNSAKVKKVAGKLGLSGASSHLRRK